MAQDGNRDLDAATQIALGQALELEGAIVVAGNEIREHSKPTYGTALLDGRLSLVAVWALLLDAYNGAPGATSDSIDHRLTLLAAFIQGVPPTEALISEGQYVKASAALKQDMEILVRIHETEQGVAKPGKTPQIRYLPASGARRFYGELNKVAHPSNPDLLQSLLGHGSPSDGAHGVALTPAFVPDTAVALYELHVYLLFEVTRELIRLFMEMYDEDDEPIKNATALWSTTSKMLLDAGHLQPEL